VLTLRIQPNEGIAMAFEAKVPGPLERLGTVKMDFSYADYFGAEPQTGYETLLYDAMNGDQTLFHRMDIVEAGWEAVMPIIGVWKDRSGDVREYEPGTWGPPEADVLLEGEGRAWRC
jgi:glucose-6-phosphate 1-dehydrogenase